MKYGNHVSGRVIGRNTIIGLFSAGLFLLGFILFSPRAGAADDYVVSIAVDGQSRTVRTSGGTVGELLDSAGVAISEFDLVEPSLDNQIDSPVFNVNIYRARPVTINDEGNSYVVMSPYSSGRLVALNAGIEVYEEDILELRLVDNLLLNGTIGQELVIDRATPIEINLYGNIFEVRTHLQTVGEVLAAKDIVPDEDDLVNPTSDTLIKQGALISVTRVGVEVISEEVAIDYRTETIWDDEMALGTQSVDQEGRDGVRIVTYEIEYHNGEEANRTELKSVVKEESVTRIVRAGTKANNAQDNVSLGQQLAVQKGWVGEQWLCLYDLWNKESRWNHLAQNPYSTAFGIPQFLDSTWAGTGYAKTTDPTIQIKAGFIYIENRYGTPCAAWQHSVNNNWY